MPLNIWNHLTHPFTYTAVNNAPQDFSPEDISRVEKIASGSVGALEAISSSRSIKFNLVAVGVTTLVIFYIAATIFKIMRSRGNADPIQPSSSGPGSGGIELNPMIDPAAQPEQRKNEDGEPSGREPIPVVPESPPPPASSPQSRLTSGAQIPSSIPEEHEEPIPVVENLSSQPAPSPLPIVPSSPETSASIPEEHEEPILVVESLSSQPVPSPLPEVPSSPETSTSIPEEHEEPILVVESLSSQPVLSHQPIAPSSPATSTSIDSSTLEKQKETEGTKVIKEEPKKADREIEEEKEELVASEPPPPEPHNSAPLSPQLVARSNPRLAGMGEQDQKKLGKQKPSIPVSPSPSVQVPMQKLYRDLPLPDEDAKIIHQIIEMMGSISAWMIPLKTPQLIELGKKIQHVHPLKFLEKVLNTPELKASMIIVEDSTVKWKGFLWGSSLDGSSGFKAKCNREIDQNNFAIYIDDFCSVVKAPIDKVRPLVEKRDWEELVRFLIKLK